MERTGSQMAVASGDRRDRVGQGTREREQRRDETEGGAAVARKRTQKKGEYGPICLPFGEATHGVFIRVRVRSDTMYATEREGGKVKSKFRVLPCRRQSARRRMRRGSGIQSESASIYCMSKRDSGRKVEGSGSGRILMARGMRRGAKRKER